MRVVTLAVANGGTTKFFDVGSSTDLARSRLRGRADAMSSTRAVIHARARHQSAMSPVVVDHTVLSLAIARAARASTGTHSGRASTCEW